MTQTKTHKDLCDTLQKQAETLLKKDLDSADKKSAFFAFLRDFYPVSSPDDLLGRSAEELTKLAWSLFKAGEKRKPGEPLITIENKGTHRTGQKPASQDQNADDDPMTDSTYLRIIADDMPFLVDSITGALSVTLRYRIHMMHHPILTTIRDDKGVRSSKGNPSAESVLYVEIDKQTDAQNLKHLKDHIQQVLSDVQSVVADFKAMLAKIDETVASHTVNPPPIDEAGAQENIAFLRWLGANHFTFLGYQEIQYQVKGKSLTYEIIPNSGLGILRDPSRHVLRHKGDTTAMAPEIEAFLQSDHPLLITKANVKATVHRNIHMDYIGVKIYDAKGKAVGERRLIGLFTSLSYSLFARDVPVLRGKVSRVLDRSPFTPNSYGSKTLNHILEGFPRDELFQIGEDLLYDTSMGVVQLMERPRPRAFMRADRFERFVSALVYVPRDVYHSQLRLAVADILCEAYNGEVSVYHAQLSDNALARWHFIIRTPPGNVPKPDEAKINDRIKEAAQGWTDRLLKHLIKRHGDEAGMTLYHRYKDRFSNAYKEAFNPTQAAYDIVAFEKVGGTDSLDVDFYRHLNDQPNHFRLKIYHGNRVVALSDCMPILENMGFKVLSEHSFELTSGTVGYIHDFRLQRISEAAFDHQTAKARIEDLFRHVWRKDAEEDGFNELVLTAGLTWSEIVILRAYGKYLRQLGLGFTPEYIADVVVKHSALARQLIDIFNLRFDPGLKDKNRVKKEAECFASLMAAFETIQSLDEDRILRAYLNVIQATLRTNCFQDGILRPRSSAQSPVEQEKVLAFKIRTTDVEEAPQPRPYAEIWVYSPRVEGVHLRGGPVARGGLRWSDRREDFRTEVLGLVKAQQVKNSVIVPQGAKGGFYAKNLPPASDRDAFWAEGVRSYRAFISSLLSVTDNLVQGEVVPPQMTMRQDGDDPYLVVAADKGTATFSDIANELSEGHGFWLGDAFASGGSNGYDHKKMGITARGAWVSVQRHLRELGINAQTDPVSVIGVGDMSGDVFGNGMLLSRTIKLRAAFNHLHIFLDPEPKDLEASFKERQRLFELPRSSWTDYDSSLISKGGGVFSRQDKSIPLSAQVREWLGVSETSLAPNDLLHLIMKAEADVLWFGGIGTYVRADSESNSDVPDRANDGLRVAAKELNVRVIGEGGNLGMTQQARIDFAAHGGRLNTDFIDNSAGVDCSDKEVNIKILLADAISSKKLSAKKRNALLVDMTDDVSDIVLRNNYLQTQAISLAEDQAPNDREYHLGLIRALERDWGLNRAIENLPTDEGFAEMAANDTGLTRPEISTLMSHTKLSLKAVLLRGNLIDDDVFLPELEAGFPPALHDPYGTYLKRHRLRREIVATILSNEVVNRAGLSFAYEIKEETGLAIEDIVAAYVVVRGLFELDTIWQQISDLDYQVDAAVQYDMLLSISESIKAQALWLLRNLDQPFDITGIIKQYQPSMQQLFEIEQSILSAPARESFVSRKTGFGKAGVPADLARFVAGFEVLQLGPDIIRVAEETGLPIDETATIHFAIGDTLGFEWLRARADSISYDQHWDTLAVRAILDDIADQQRMLVLGVCSKKGPKGADQRLDAWRSEAQTKIIRADRLVEDLKGSGVFSIAKLSFAARHLRSILK